MSNQLFYADNLTVLKEHIPAQSVDLIYLDPPFNSETVYNVIFKDEFGEGSSAQAEAFKDTWNWRDGAAEAYEEVLSHGGDVAVALAGFRGWLGETGLLAYCAMMAIRLIHLRRALKPTGSLYLHCDPTASHYIKIIMDAVFGHRSYRNEIVWQRLYGGKSDAGQYGRNSDRLLFYTASDNFTFTPPRLNEHNEKTVAQWYKNRDERGAYVSRPLTAAGATRGDSGQPWRGRPPNGHWAVPRILEARYEAETSNTLTGSVRERLETLAQAGYVDFSANGNPSWRRYLDEAEKPRVHDLWVDDEVKPISRTSAERLGFPTQKPRALLKRIIEASSKPGDLVLDPFCGCGTSIYAAQELGRRWIGVDITHYAVTLIEEHLKKKFSRASFTVTGRPVDLQGAYDLADRDKHQLQWWASWLLGAQSYRQEKRGADRGIDGRIMFLNGPYGAGTIIVSVKGGQNIGVAAVRELLGTMTRDNAEMGVLVTLYPPTRNMMAEAAAAGYVKQSAHGPLRRLQVITVEELLAGRRPHFPPLPRSEEQPAPTRKKASEQLELLLPFTNEQPIAAEGTVVDPRFLRLPARARG